MITSCSNLQTDENDVKFLFHLAGIIKILNFLMSSSYFLDSLTLGFVHQSGFCGVLKGVFMKINVGLGLLRKISTFDCY